MWLGLASILIMGGGAFYLGWNLFSGQMEAAAAARLQTERKRATNGLLRINRPLFRALVLPYSLQWKRWADWKKKHKRTIISAGLEDELDADELLAYKISMGVVIPCGLMLYTLANGSSLPAWLFISMLIGGYIYPTAWVKGCRKNRHEEINLQLPFVLDLLTLSTEAGLDFIGALQKVVEKTRAGPLVNELERMLQQIQLGTSRADSLRDLGWRIDLQEISSLVAVLVTADQMGSPLGPVLRVQSDLIRTQRFTKAEKRGAAASQKLLFPLIFFIMPAVFIMIFGPVILGFLGVK
jgi:tight adherence protein C